MGLRLAGGEVSYLNSVEGRRLKSPVLIGLL